MQLSRIATAGLAGALTLALGSCATEADNYRYTRKKAQATLTKVEKPGLVIGEFHLADDGVIDGDTIKVKGLDSSLRLLAIDTEEIWHHKKNKRAAEVDFQAYLAQKRSESKRPPKTGTPMGVEAWKWAEKFFADADIVRLERDSPKEIRGRYNRYLSYVFVKKNGSWVNYNVACVRAGMAPYFTKYGYSRRFHQEFVDAQNEARAAKRGIWDPNAKAYGDYDQRIPWWNARADFIKQFEIDAQGRDDMIELTNWDAIQRLEQHVGKEVEVLGLVGGIRKGKRGPTKVMLSRRLFNDFPIIFFDRDVYMATGIGRYRGEFVRVRGVVNKYHNKYNGRDSLQIMVNLPSQVKLSKVPGIEEPS